MTTPVRTRLGSALLALILVVIASSTPVALAVTPPALDPSLVPQDGTPGPDEAMRQSTLCAEPIAAATPPVTVAAPGFGMLSVADAWRYSTGNGVTVALIDTGVQPDPRLPVVAGGDYVTGGDGLTDCDGHGTILASIIAAAPQGTPMPAPLPSHPAWGAVEVPARPAPAGQPDGVAGVAPHARILSIRQSSRAFQPARPAGVDDLGTERMAGTLATLARAIVHAANMGAQVITIGVAACVSAADPLDQGAIGAAVWYAATVKDTVLVAAGGNADEDGCAQNPTPNVVTAENRGWDGVKTVSSPSWFTDHVLSVGAVDQVGAPLIKSLAGPWIGVAGPGAQITGLSPRNGEPVNAYPPRRAGEAAIPLWGTSFAAAYVGGVAALVRAKFPQLSASQVIQRVQQTAHNPPGGVDNRVGFGLVDPVAALTFNGPNAPPVGTGSDTRVLQPPASPPPADHRARSTALGFAATVLFCIGLTGMIVRARRSR